MTFVSAILLTILAYLLGSIPVGYLIIKRKIGKDIRTLGSGSSGATNVARQCGWLWGIITLLGDFVKGSIPCLIAIFLFQLHWLVGLIGLFAVIGHNFPIFVSNPRFKGGKGVATTAGAIIPILTMAALSYDSLWVWLVPLIIVCCWIAIIKISRLMSLASAFLMVSIIIFFIVLEFLTETTYLTVFIALMAGIVLWAHQKNWQRLRQGTESQIESKWKK